MFYSSDPLYTKTTTQEDNNTTATTKSEQIMNSSAAAPLSGSSLGAPPANTTAAAATTNSSSSSSTYGITPEQASKNFDALRREATKLERHLEDRVARYQQVSLLFFLSLSLVLIDWF